jgi:hypothetical protein
MESEFVDTIGVIAGGLWLAGALYWQVVSRRDCPVKYSVAMTIVGTSLLFGSSAIVVQTTSEAAIALGIVANLLMLALGIAVHVHLSRSLDDEDDDSGNGAAESARTPDSDVR